MKRTRDQIRAQDDALLKKERAIKVANFVLFCLFLLYAIPSLYVVSLGHTSGHISDVFFPLLVFLLLAHINNLHLKHIASVKLYREDAEKSQPESGHVRK